MMQKNEKLHRIEALKKQKNAVILAHYYVLDEVQEIADYIGDSFYLSKIAQKIDSSIIMLCGVSFMGESAKLLNPSKKVIIPVADADCPMAHMANPERIAQVRKEYEDVAVVCYVNSTSQLKAASDVCVTSANALAVVKALPNKRIYFIPDQNLAHYISSLLPDKEFIYHDGYCHVHHHVTQDQLLDIRRQYPNALVLAHPECRGEVLQYADYAGSTSGILDFASKSDAKEFIIVTEVGVLYELKRRCPDKVFHSMPQMVCSNMKKITLDCVLNSLEQETSEILLADDLIHAAQLPLKRMLELA